MCIDAKHSCMKTYEDCRPFFRNLRKALDLYTVVEKLPQDIGQGRIMYPAEVHMLETLIEYDGASITALAKINGVTKGAVSQLVSKLANRGFVKKIPDPDNKSRLIVHCTDAGRGICELHLAFHRQRDREFMDYVRKLDEAEFRTVSEFAARMRSWLATYQE